MSPDGYVKGGLFFFAAAVILWWLSTLRLTGTTDGGKLRLRIGAGIGVAMGLFHLYKGLFHAG